MKRLNLLANMSLAVLMTIATPVVFTAPFGQHGAAQAAVADFEAALALHNAARDGKGAAEEAVKALEAYTAAEPAQAEGWAYLGSAYAISARDAGSVTDKIRFTNRGLRFLDQAVAQAPQDFVVRVIRANVLMNLPAMFGREDMLVGDLMTLHQMYQAAQNPRMAAPMVGIYGALATHAAKAEDWPALQAAAQTTAGSL